jgi:peptidoglycan/xylan/chitin deacetylase (PgdA/CDA1 family)
MNWKHYTKYKISSIFSMYRNIIGPRNGFRLLMYHSISNGVQDDPENFFTVNPNLFKKQIKILKQSNYLKIVSLQDGLKLVSNNKLQLSITFDDGYADNLYNAAPLMLSNNIPFTVFVVSNFIKKNVKDYLSQDELIELSNLPGVTIGSHGLTHTPFTDLSTKELINELVYSKKYLEDKIGKEVKYISYPHGKINNFLLKYIKEAGYTIGGTSNFNINNSIDEPLLLNRNVITSLDSNEVFMNKIKGSSDWFHLLEKFKFY